MNFSDRVWFGALQGAAGKVEQSRIVAGERRRGGTEPLGAKSSSASQIALPVRLARSSV